MSRKKYRNYEYSEDHDLTCMCDLCCSVAEESPKQKIPRKKNKMYQSKQIKKVPKWQRTNRNDIESEW